MERGADQDPGIEQLLRSATVGSPPEPSPDLVLRTIGRIRRWIVFGDLLRLATLEAIWVRGTRPEDQVGQTDEAGHHGIDRAEESHSE